MVTRFAARCGHEFFGPLFRVCRKEEATREGGPCLVGQATFRVAPLQSPLSSLDDPKLAARLYVIMDETDDVLPIPCGFVPIGEPDGRSGPIVRDACHAVLHHQGRI